MNEYKQYKDLVLTIALRYGVFNLEDSIQNGWIGLLKAKKTFNPSFGIKFNTYAYKYIMGEVINNRDSNSNIELDENDLEFNTDEYLIEDTLEKKCLTCMSKLDADIIKSRILYDYKLTEIAEELGVSSQAIHERFHRNFKKLKEVYANDISQTL